MSKSIETLIGFEKLSSDESVDDLRVCDLNDNQELMGQSCYVQKNYINILLLGETSVEKRTFLNEFVNYLCYETLAEALYGEHVWPIPSGSLKFANPETLEDLVLTYGADDNDYPESQIYTPYEFSFRDSMIQLIDGPSVCDADKNLMNFNAIFEFVIQYEELHCICILLAVNNESKTQEIWIKQILSHLHKSACNNIVFLFPNTMSTFNNSGNAATLRSILSSMKSTSPYMNIAFKRDIIYCVDNEAFNFMVALKNGIEFSSDFKNTYEGIWNTSAKECHRLMEYIMGNSDGRLGLTAHSIQDSLALNETRLMIVVLSKQTARIRESITDRSNDVKQNYTNIINVETDEVELLRDRLYLTQEDLEITRLKAPNLVSTHRKKTTIVNVEGVRKYHYNTVCHRECNCSADMRKDIIGDESLKKCSAIIGFPLNLCKSCGNAYDEHMLIGYESRVVTKQVMDCEVEALIDSKEAILVKTNQLVSKLKDHCIGEELELMVGLSAMFAQYVKNNMIFAVNDSYKAFLVELIHSEESLTIGDNFTLHVYEQMLDNYEQENQVLEEAMNAANTTHTVISTQEVFDKIKCLHQLKIYGKKLQGSQLAHRNEERAMD